MEKSEFKKALLEKASEVSDVNLPNLELALNVSESIEVFLAAIHRLIENVTGFSTNYFKVLRLLYVYSPEGLALSKIAEHVGITRASMTQIINNLETRGIVTRVENPKDKRSSLVSLTPEGLEEVREIFVTYHSAISNLVDQVGSTSMQSVIDHLINRINRFSKV